MHAEGKGKPEVPLDTRLRSGKPYKTEPIQQRRASTSGAAGVIGATGATKPKVMTAEDALTKALNRINESLESLTKQGAETSRQVTETNKRVAEISTKIDLNTASINELGKKVNSNTQSIEKLLEESSTTRKIAEEAREVAIATQDKIPPVQEKLADHDLTLSMIELQRKERNLRIRLVPEIEKDNLAEFLTTEILEFWKLDQEKEDLKIVSAFRLGFKQKKNKPRDCLITLRSKEERDKILNWHYQKTLEIGNSFVEIFKDIPKLILDIRTYYRDLTTLLKRNNIFFRWEYPQGLSFKFRGKKIRIKTLSEKDKFLRDYGEDLQKEVDRGEETTVKGLLDVANLSFGLKSTTEEEELLGAVGGKDK